MTEHPQADPVEETGDQEAADVTRRIRAAIEAGIADSKAGRTIPVEELRASYGLDP